MKKVMQWMLAVMVAMAGVGCEDSDPVLPNKDNIQEINRIIDSSVACYGAYDPTCVTELLCGKQWEIWSDLVYREAERLNLYNWGIFRGTINDHGGELPVGGGPYKKHTWQFLEDGTLLYTNDGKTDDLTRTWSFDPETRAFTFTYASEEEQETRVRYLKALGDSYMMWEFDSGMPFLDYYTLEEYIPLEN